MAFFGMSENSTGRGATVAVGKGACVGGGVVGARVIVVESLVLVSLFYKLQPLLVVMHLRAIVRPKCIRIESETSCIVKTAIVGGVRLRAALMMCDDEPVLSSK